MPPRRARGRRARVAPARDPPGDLGLRGHDDARDHGVVPRRRPRLAPRASARRPYRPHLTAEAGPGPPDAPGRAAEPGRGGGASRRVSQRRAPNAAAAIRIARMNTITCPPGSRVMSSMAAPTSAAAGSVRIHATRMFPATPQRTAENPRIAPAPSTEPDTVWVVDTGKPRCAVAQRMDAVAVWAAKPCGGSIFAIRWPS